MKRSVWIVIVVVIAATLVAVRVKRMREKENAPLISAPPVAVDTTTVTHGSVVRSRHVLGTVLGTDEADIAPRVMAQVMEVRVREGDPVTRGELLATLDARELEDAVAEAEAEVEAAKEGLAAAETARATQRDATARDKRLVEAKAISQEQWDHSRAADAASAARLEAARAQVEVAVKRLDQARTRLDYCRLTAPVTGVVARRLADPGDLGVPGKPLLEIVRQERVRVRASVPPENLTDLEVGRPLTLTLGDLSVDAVVSRVFPAMGNSHLAAFEADLTSPPPGFVSGATVGVDVHLSSAEGLTVPGDALLEGERGAWVFKVADGTVHPVRVTVVDRSHDAAVVNGPLSAGEAVIVARPSRLMTFADGMKVKVAESES
jgi:RND family efflux transporter MFP subunit